MPRVRGHIVIEDYVVDVLLRDLTGHDQQPSAFLVYLHLYALAARARWRPVARSLRDIADATGLSKSAVQSALATLERRELLRAERAHATATPRLSVLRHWRGR
jgi:DNA-binding MarR family transcriptional regulator